MFIRSKLDDGVRMEDSKVDINAKFYGCVKLLPVVFDPVQVGKIVCHSSAYVVETLRSWILLFQNYVCSIKATDT